MKFVDSNGKGFINFAQTHQFCWKKTKGLLSGLGRGGGRLQVQIFGVLHWKNFTLGCLQYVTLMEHLVYEEEPEDDLCAAFRLLSNGSKNIKKKDLMNLMKECMEESEKDTIEKNINMMLTEARDMLSFDDFLNVMLPENDS